jgi:hypothetical protein
MPLTVSLINIIFTRYKAADAARLAIAHT